MADYVFRFIPLADVLAYGLVLNWLEPYLKSGGYGAYLSESYDWRGAQIV